MPGALIPRACRDRDPNAGFAEADDEDAETIGVLRASPSCSAIPAFYNGSARRGGLPECAKFVSFSGLLLIRSEPVFDWIG